MSASPFKDANAPAQSASGAPPPVRPSWEVAADTGRATLPTRQSQTPPLPVPPARPPAFPPSALPAAAALPPRTAAPAAPLLPTSEPDAETAYDLAGNPLPQAAPAPSPYAAPAPMGIPAPYPPPAPYGYSAGSAPAGVWPPAPGGPPAAGLRNNSGEQSHLPPEIERLRWHWGAFFFPVLWTKNHGLTTVAAMIGGGFFALRMLRYFLQFLSPLAFFGLCVVYGVTYFGIQVYFGLNGHKIGWRNRHFQGGLEEYFKVQKAWMWWGLGIFIVSWIVLPMLLLGTLGIGAMAPHSGYNSGSESGGYSSPNGSSDNSSDSSSDSSASTPAGGSDSAAPGGTNSAPAGSSGAQ